VKTKHRTLIKATLASTGLVLLASSIAFLLHSHEFSAGSRGPASNVVVIKRRAPLFENAPGKQKLSSNDAFLKTGIRALRARWVVFHPEPLFEGGAQNERLVRFPLFDNLVLTVLLQAESAYDVNSGLLVGTVEGEPGSRVRLTLTDSHISGSISTRKSQYEILDGGAGLHIILETQN
jgi:hypothetical protein